MKSKKSWVEKLSQPKESKVVVLEKPWGGMEAGDKMFISTPQEVDLAIRTLPAGRVTAVSDFRQYLASKHQCVGACHLTTSIFIRMSAEAARERIDAGEPSSEVTPFWRVIAPGSPIAKKMLIDDAWLVQRLAEEQSNHGM